ncbi:MAG: tetratricopeptide repeat protein [Lunatimonas sp.]|uniref:tetratricopeptide repeat protein n=1 Tax=Lunatimonas sp. TaxID=2060141 RepID=UPI00263B1969|nr:tetratricopeptide repeat protein [Lunatimonas sp.]MCC5938908.1 tetratricopeptide repeat protein [Lunatimonas sp.]
MREEAINWNNQGVAHFFKQEWEKARECYERALELDEQNPAVWNNLGLLAHQQKNFPQACAHFRRAFELEPKSNYLVNEANALAMQGDLNGAEANYLKALDLQDDYVPAFASLAKLYTHQGRSNEAIAAYQRLTEISQEQEYPFQLALLQIQQGEFDTALQLLYKLARNRESTEIWFQVGRAEFLAKNYGRAESAFKRALAENPDDKASRNFLAVNLLAMGRREEALKQYLFLLKFFPDDTDLLTDTAVVLCGMERFEEATTYLDRALTIQSDHQKALIYKDRIKQIQQS